MALAPKALIPLVDEATNCWGDNCSALGWRASINWKPLRPLLKGGLAAWTSHHLNSLVKIIGKGVGEGDRPNSSGSLACERCGAPNTSLYHKNYECSALGILPQNNARSAPKAAPELLENKA